MRGEREERATMGQGKSIRGGVGVGDSGEGCGNGEE